MKIDFDTKLLNLDGAVMKDKDKDVTLRSASVEALMLFVDIDRSATGEVKLKRYEIAAKINKGGEVELLPEEIAMVKARIGEVYGPMVIGPAYKLLNG